MFSSLLLPTRTHHFIFVVPLFVVGLHPALCVSGLPCFIGSHVHTYFTDFWDISMVFSEDCHEIFTRPFPANEVNPDPRGALLHGDLVAVPRNRIIPRHFNGRRAPAEAVATRWPCLPQHPQIS